MLAAEKEGIVLKGSIGGAIEVDEQWEAEAGYVADRDAAREAGEDFDWSD